MVFGYSHFSDFGASLHDTMKSCKNEFLLLQVFNMNAPVPPVNEPETLKQQNQYQASYNQSFSNQPHQVEQSDLQQEQLQTGKILVALVEQMVVCEVLDDGAKHVTGSLANLSPEQYQVLLLCVWISNREWNSVYLSPTVKPLDWVLYVSLNKDTNRIILKVKAVEWSTCSADAKVALNK